MTFRQSVWKLNVSETDIWKVIRIMNCSIVTSRILILWRHNDILPIILRFVKQAVRQYIITLIILLIVPAVNLSGLTLSRMRKRLSEIGVRKAFGAPRRELMMQVLSENMLYSLLGGVLGLILSYGATFFLGSMLFSIDFMGNGVTDLRTMCMDLLFDPVVFLLAFFACFALNLLSAAIPAWRVTRTNIVDAINER